MECHVFQGQHRRAGENRKRREQSVTHRHPHAVEISTTGARARPQALTPRFQGHVAARRRRVPETTRSREEGYHKLGNAMTTHRLGDTPRRFHDHLHARFDNTHTDRSTPVNKSRGCPHHNDAYAQTARRPAKPLVRAHLRKAVNKAQCGVNYTPH